MSMAWMRAPGQTWIGAAGSFLGMWVAMMVAMMLPSLAPQLWRYRQVVGRRDSARQDGVTVRAALGYFLVWAVLGMAVYPLGVVLSTLEMELPSLARFVPIATGAVVLVAGALQFTAWKRRHLACCREVPGCCSGPGPAAESAWRYGIRQGIHCTCCCLGLTLTLLAIGVMDLRAMAVVTAAISLERLAPGGERVARGIGAGVVGAGLFLIARAVMPSHG
jgi:predicted metal-binding membrane protein